MKRIKLCILLIIVAIGSLLPVYIWAKMSLGEEIVVTMRNPEGDTKIYHSRDEVKFKGVKRELPLGDLEWRKSLCREETPDEKLDFAEAQIELDTIIDQINSSKKPRKLSEYHKDFLSTIPPCAPYITKLRVIVRLLKDYDLIELSYK